MSRLTVKWRNMLIAMLAAAGFAAFAMELVGIDASAEPPAVVSVSGLVSSCERVAGGLLLAIEGDEDIILSVSGTDADLGYRLISSDGTILAEGECPFVPLSDYPESSSVFVFAIDGSSLDAVAGVSVAPAPATTTIPFPLQRGGADSVVELDIDQQATIMTGRADFADKDAHPALMLRDAGGAYPGLSGAFTVTVSIANAVSGFSLLGFSQPGGTTTMEGIPEIDFSGPGHVNIYSVFGSGGEFVPPLTGNYAFQVEADDKMVLSVGHAVATAEWPSCATGEVVRARFRAGVRYPVSFRMSSVGGPGVARVLKFAEFTPDGPVGIVVSNHNVKFSRKMATMPTAVAHKYMIEGNPDPDSTYEVRCIHCDDGISVAGAVATPDAGSPVWDDTNRTATVVFALYKNDTEMIDTDSAIFTQMPEKEEECDCDCEEGTKSDAGCVEFSQRFGRTPWIAGLPVGRLAVRETGPVARLWTPSALIYDHPMCRRMAVRRGANPLDVVILDPFGKGTEYRGGRPAGTSAGLARGIRYDDGLLVEVMEDRTEIKYNADGSVKSIRPPDGEPVPVEDLGIDILRDAGTGAITSVVSRADGRIDVAAVSTNSYCATWQGPSGAFVKSFTFSGDGSTTFHLHEYRSEQFQFDSEWTYDATVQDWAFTRAPGTDAAKTWAKSIFYDETNRAWNVMRTTLDSTGAVVRTETSVLDVADRTIKETERTVGGRTLYSAQRNATGTVASDVNDMGLSTSYLYDGWNRVTNETATVKGGILRKTEWTYSGEGASGGVIDRRPRRRVVTENGTVVEDEETVYESNRVTRVRHAGEAERTSFRELDAQGRTVLSVDETGRAASTEYSPFDADDLSWTETRDEGVWTEADGFATVNGKSTRRVTSYDASGNAVAVHDYALVGGEWLETAWTTNRYNATHKVVFSGSSNGKTSSADWICTGPVWQIGEDGIATTNTYDAAKAKAVSVRYGPHGAVTTTYAYDAEGRVVAEAESADGCETRTRRRSYDEEGRLVSETDAQGLTTAYAYSSDGRTTAVTLPSGGTRVTTLNPDGSLASVTGTAVTPEYRTYGVTSDGLAWERTSYRSPDGARWTKTYRNGFGDVVREERPGANGSTLATEYSYNAKGQLVSVTATGEPTETRVYDTWGDVVSVVRSADGTYRVSQSLSGNEELDGEVWNVETRAEYCSDYSIEPLVTTNMTQLSGLSLANEARRISYDVRGNASETMTEFDPSTSTRLTRTTIPTAANAALVESVDGVQTLSVSHSAVTNAVEYDAFRRAVAKIDGRGNATTNAYDSLGRLASVTDPAGATTSYAYDAAGNLAAVTNALGVATVYEYDVKGNKTYEGGGTYPVSYAYDDYNVMTNMTTYRNAVGRDDPIAPQGGDTTTWTYDEATGLLLSKTYADGYGPSYAYTDNGNLAVRTWARGTATTYSYDGWNSLTNTVYSDGTRPMSFAYDAMGRQVYAKDEGGITTTSYDAAGAVETESVTGRLYTRTLLRHRDAFGRETGYSLNNSRKTVVEYEADTGRTKRIQNAGVWFTYSYLPGTDLKSRLQYGGSGSAYYTYEPNRDLLTQVQNYINGGVVSQYDYVNDAIGRRTEISRSGSRMTESRTDAYGYNDRNELVSGTKSGGSQSPATEYEYSYDDIGNRLSSLDLGTDRTYDANNLNQYTSISNAVGETFSPIFDLDGNQTLVRTATGDWTVAYNAENRPVSWTCGTTNIVMLFDRMGRRVEYVETVTDGSGESPVTTTNRHHRFVYEGYLCVQRLNARSGNAIELSFAWDPTEPVATRPLVLQRQGGWNFFYTHDGNKNVSDVVSFQQARGVPAHYEYAPFGTVTAMTKATTITAFDVRTLNPFRFSSEYADDTLGLVYYNYRHYDAVYGRWMCRDMDATNKNEKYLFLSNSSVHAFDMLGLRISEARCNEILNSLWDGVNRVGLDMEVVALNENITYWGCENPKPRCMCSIAAKRSGGFNPDDNTIEINTYYSSESSVRTTLLHELQHRLDWCVNGKEMPLGCDELGYWEVRAELRGGRCGSVDNPARPIDWDCVRRNALKSTEKHAQCEITAGKAVDRGIERMKNQGGRP